jgi:hypothetical protein
MDGGLRIFLEGAGIAGFGSRRGGSGMASLFFMQARRIITKFDLALSENSSKAGLYIFLLVQ